MSQNNNSKGKKSYEYSINPGLTEKLRLYTKRFFCHQSIYTKKIKDYPVRVMNITENII